LEGSHTPFVFELVCWIRVLEIQNDGFFAGSASILATA